MPNSFKGEVLNQWGNDLKQSNSAENKYSVNTAISDTRLKVVTAELEMVVIDQDEKIVPSLILKEQPRLSLELLQNLKYFSELLVAWGQSHKSIQICKVIQRAYKLFEKIHGEKKSSLFTDYLMFSENSLHQKDASISVPEHCENCTNPNLICQICNLTVRGLAFQCVMCGHGGHINHVKAWVIKQQDSKRGSENFTNQDQEPLKCPCGWCDCQLCFVSLINNM